MCGGWGWGGGLNSFSNFFVLFRRDNFDWDLESRIVVVLQSDWTWDQICFVSILGKWQFSHFWIRENETGDRCWGQRVENEKEENRRQWFHMQESNKDKDKTRPMHSQWSLRFNTLENTPSWKNRWHYCNAIFHGVFLAVDTEFPVNACRVATQLLLLLLSTSCWVALRVVREKVKQTTCRPTELRE